MNSRRRWLAAAVAGFFLMGVPGCLEIGVKTTVNGDGSCDREVTLKSDSTTLPSTAFPVPVDSTWQTSWSEVGDTNKSYLYTARKHFDTFEQLSREYATPPDSERLAIAVTVEKDFRWFYTYFRYQETIRVFNPLTVVPASEMLTQDEIRRIGRGEKSDSLKEKYEAWEERNYVEMFYRALLQGSKELNDPALPPAMIESKKEQLAHVLQSESKTTKDDAGNVDPYVRVLVKFFGTRSVERLRPQLQGAMDEIVRRMELKGKASAAYTSAVVMPGILLDTNSDDVKGATAGWKFESDQFSITDYQMWAESRVVNVWAFVLTALVVVGLVVLLALPRFRRHTA